MTLAKRRQTRDPQAGFTLIEALVAMVILGLGAVSLLSAAEGYTSRISSVTDRVAARWVAQNALASARLNLPLQEQGANMYGIAYDITREATPTDDPDLSAITLRVMRRDTGAQMFVLDSYVKVP